MSSEAEQTASTCKPEWERRRGGTYGQKYRLNCTTHGTVYGWVSPGNNTGSRYMVIEANAAWTAHVAQHQAGGSDNP